MSWLFQVPAGAIPKLSQPSGMDTGHRQRHDRCVPARLHRFQLIARKETYRLAVRAPEWIARAIRATNRPCIDRGQRSHPQRRPGFRIRDERDVSAVGRHVEIDRQCREAPALGSENWKLDVLGRRRRHVATVEQHRSPNVSVRAAAAIQTRRGRRAVTRLRADVFGTDGAAGVRARCASARSRSAAD